MTKELKELRNFLTEKKQELAQNPHLYEDIYCDCLNAIINYMNNTQERNLEEFTRRITDRELTLQYLKSIIEKADDLDNLHYKIDGVRFWGENFFVIDEVYGNIENITTGTILDRIQEVIDEIEYK